MRILFQPPRTRIACRVCPEVREDAWGSLSTIVVGLNASAQIEAGILGAPVLTLLAPGFEKGQSGPLTDMAPEKPSVVRRWLHSATRVGQ